MAQPGRRVDRYAVVHVDFDALSGPIALADTVVEHPTFSSRSGGGWDGEAASDGDCGSEPRSP